MRLHFVGIAGSGASSVASICREKGFIVSGCDLDPKSPFLGELRKRKIKVSFQHSVSHLENVDKLIISPAITSLDPKNPEVFAARNLKIPVLTWQQFLGQFLTKGKFVITVAGSHGKSTTVAIVAFILEKVGFDPTVVLGAIYPLWGTNFRFSKSKYLVIEADEYAENFLNYRSNIAVITNIDYDHPEYFKTKKEFTQTFQKFISNTKKGSTLILGPNIGFENRNGTTLRYKETKNLSLIIPGKFNKINATLAVAVAERLGIKNSTNLLSKFKGIERRFEFKGEEKDIKVFEDYAHHPTEIAATLEAAREKFPKNRIWCVFQPHMFTRTKVLFKDFAKAFENSKVDKIIIVDIFAAREKNSHKITSFDLVKAIKSKEVKYIGDLRKGADYLLNNLSSSDVLLVLGAGDVFILSKLVLAGLKNGKN